MTSTSSLSLHGSRKVGGILLILIGISGCGGSDTEKPPEVYPVKGKVVYRDGTAFRGGTIELHPTEASKYSIIGAIDQAGAFTLATLSDKDRYEGVPAGQYKVMVMPDLSLGAEAQPINLPQMVTIKAEENNTTITVPLNPPRK